MAKRLKFRISRVIPSFQSCRSKDPSTLPSNPVPSFFRPSPVKTTKLFNLHFPPSTQPPKPHHSSLRRHVSSAFTSVGCGCRSRPTLSDDDRSESLEFQWEKEDNWHVVAKVYDETPRRKIYNSSVSGESDSEDDDVLSLPPPPPPPPTVEKKKRRVKKKKTTSKIRISTSSGDSVFFSSEGCDERDEEETETLVSSSRSFSTDSSSEFNPHLETIREIPQPRSRKKKAKNVKRCVSKKLVISSPECESPARLSMFQRLIPCTVEGKLRESFAVVKKSEDPYEDFKRSMMDMILEKEMFDEKDLEQLLHCFLSLNAREYHGVIIQAFSEIWQALFSKRSTSPRVSRPL
uniref:Transcription repressor n=1 Tax=Fagus sylvatica TaxID=28930 RepID=A0A2N9JAP6_FAGSY